MFVSFDIVWKIVNCLNFYIATNQCAVVVGLKWIPIFFVHTANRKPKWNATKKIMKKMLVSSVWMCVHGEKERKIEWLHIEKRGK